MADKQKGVSMTRHSSLIQLGMDLGYFNTAAGICLGFSAAWLEACFISEEKIFNERVDRIQQINSSTFLTKLNEIKEKVKQHRPLSPLETESLDILAFFEKISLYQNPQLHHQLFDETLMQVDLEQIAQFAASDKIMEKGKIATLTSNIGLYNEENLTKHLLAIATAIKTSNPSSDREVGLIISTTNHAMALIFETQSNDGIETAYLRFMDINLPKSVTWPMQKLANIAAYIHDNYYEEQKNERFLITTSIVATGNNKNSLDLLERIELTIPNERSDGENDALAKAALIQGNVAVLDRMELEMLSDYVNNISYTIHPRTLIYLLEKGVDPYLILNQAAKSGYPSVINACANLKIDVNIPFDPHQFGHPLFAAAINGHANVLQAFYDQGASLELINAKYHNNIAHMAAQSRHANVITFLAANCPKLLDQKNNKNQNVAQVAAASGAIEVLRVLMKHDKKLDLQGLLFTAAEHGHVHLIPFLQSHGVDLNKPNKNGVTAAHYAAYFQQPLFLAKLAEQNVDLCSVDHQGKTPLMFASIPFDDFLASKKDPKIIEQIAAIIETQAKYFRNNIFDVSILNTRGEQIKPAFSLAEYEITSSSCFTASLTTHTDPFPKKLPTDYFATCVYHFCAQASGQLAEKGGYLDLAKIGLLGSDANAFTPDYIKSMSTLLFLTMAARYLRQNEFNQHNSQLFEQLNSSMNALVKRDEDSINSFLIQSMEIVKQFIIPGISSITIKSNITNPINQSTSSARGFFSQPQVNLGLNDLFGLYKIKEPANESLKTKCEQLLRRIASMGAYQHMRLFFTLSQEQKANADIDAQAPESKKTALHWLIKCAQKANPSESENYLRSYTLLLEQGARTDVLDNDKLSPLDYDTNALFGSSAKNRA